MNVMSGNYWYFKRNWDQLACKISTVWRDAIIIRLELINEVRVMNLSKTAKEHGAALANQEY